MNRLIPIQTKEESNFIILCYKSVLSVRFLQHQTAVTVVEREIARLLSLRIEDRNRNLELRPSYRRTQNDSRLVNTSLIIRSASIHNLDIHLEVDPTL